jgi:hypothetical protein
MPIILEIVYERGKKSRQKKFDVWYQHTKKRKNSLVSDSVVSNVVVVSGWEMIKVFSCSNIGKIFFLSPFTLPRGCATFWHRKLCNVEKSVSHFII